MPDFDARRVDHFADFVGAVFSSINQIAQIDGAANF